MLTFFSGVFAYNSLISGYENLEGFSQGFDVGSESREELLRVQENLTGLNQILNQMFFNLFFSILFILVVSTLLLGTTGLLGYRFLESKKFSVKYFLKFGGLFFIWALVISLFTFLINSSLEGLTGAIILWIVLLVLFYLMLVSFSSFLVRDKVFKALKDVYDLGIKKFKVLFLDYFIWMVVIFLAGFIFTYLSNLFKIFSLIATVLFLFLLIVMRIGLLRNVRNLIAGNRI